MKSIRPLLTVFVCVAVTAAAYANSQQAPNTAAEASVAPAYQLQLENEYRLVLRDAEAFKLKSSPAYRLKAPWGHPDPAPEPAAVAEVPPLPQPKVARPFHAEVMAAARASGLEPALIHAVIRTESAYQPRVVSPKGAVGLMQLVPDTARRYGVRRITNPLENVRGGARYLSDLLRLFGGNLPLALAAYNAGEGAVLRSGGIPRYPETRRYIPRVIAEYERLRHGAIVARAIGALN